MANRRIKQEDKDALIEDLHECLIDRTIEIRRVGGGATTNGRTDYYRVVVWGLHDGRPTLSWYLTYKVHLALGYRFSTTKEALIIGGLNTPKECELAQSLADLAGAPLFVVADDRPLTRYVPSKQRVNP